MSENVRKLVGVVAMAALVVVGVAVSSGDDTDFTRNRSFSAAPATFVNADKAADCCDQNAYEISLLQAKYEDLQNEIALLKGKYEASTGGASPDVQQIADGMAEACHYAEQANWGHVLEPNSGAKCMRSYLVGFPLELARQVVLTHGEYGFFHRFNLDLAEFSASGSVANWSKLGEAVTEESCGPIFYGYNPPPRFVFAVDTKDGLVVPIYSEFYYSHHEGVTSYIQHPDHWDLIPGPNWGSGMTGQYPSEVFYWPWIVKTMLICK